MLSERILLTCLVGLVLLDMAFVQMTGAAGRHWLGALYLLTLASPFLVRFRDRRLYRLVWNLGLITIFLLLVRHSLRADMANVLELGLLLAAFCQVHLLNNLRSKQPTELLFVNAFLIAIIAAFMNSGSAFPIAFLVFAGLFVVGLQLLAASRHGPAASPAAARRLVLDGARRAGLTLVLSLVVFLFWPRDFERRAYFHGRIDFAPSSPSDELEVGFSEVLELDRSGQVSSSDKIVLRATLLEGPTSTVSPLWRGATLGATDGGTWRGLGVYDRRVASHSDDGWSREGTRWERFERSAPEEGEPSLAPEPEDLPSVEVDIERLDMQTARLFLPLHVRAVDIADRDIPHPHHDGTFEVSTRDRVNYRATLEPATDADRLGGTHGPELPAELEPYVALPKKSRLRFISELAVNLTAELPEDAEQHRLVAKLAEHLEETYEYAPPGTEGAARSLAEFLRGEAPGHCEFFASALATMLRSLDVPCRVVTGLRSTRWSERTLLFAMSDAHAWVEVHDPATGWYAVDPSPLVVVGAEGQGLWARLRSGARSFWGAVSGFDDAGRASFYAFLRGLPARTGRALRDQPMTFVGVPALVALFLLYRFHLRRSAVPLVLRSYRRAIRTAGLALEPGETPRELLARARSADDSVRGLAELEAATRAHEHARYAGRS